MVNKVISIILALIIIGAIGTLGYVIANPKVGEGFTEFYVLGTEGMAEGYPEVMTVGEEGQVLLGIVNREHQSVSYEVKIVVAGTLNQEIGPIELADGGRWEDEVGFIAEEPGEQQKVEFRLYKTLMLGDSDETSFSLWIGEQYLSTRVANRGQSEASYRIDLEIEGSEEQETRIESAGPMVLASGEAWSKALDYSSPEAVTHKVRLSLYRDESQLATGHYVNKASQFDGKLIYRETYTIGSTLYLWVDVNESNTNN
ncbi:MAG: DUF1616 domain-containing protein [Planctomycetes bacterium]|nr:DUF1616 domain-containing protein [Planctomycetota bacterium]